MNAPAATRRQIVAGGLLAAAGMRAAAAEALRHDWPHGLATPPLALPLIDGTTWRLAEARGRVAVINFWASWCEPCREEMPALEWLAAHHERDGLAVVAVNYKESAAAIRRYTERRPLALPIARDADGAAARAYGVRIFPTTVLLGRDGRAACSVLGAADWTAAPARSWVVALLQQRTAAIRSHDRGES
jgi:thiol-disulfide isomerase/thioredoxin